MFSCFTEKDPSSDMYSFNEYKKFRERCIEQTRHKAKKHKNRTVQIIPRLSGIIGHRQKQPENYPIPSNKKARLTRGVLDYIYWWAHQDLNLGPKDYESSALTN